MSLPHIIAMCVAVVLLCIVGLVVFLLSLRARIEIEAKNTDFHVAVRVLFLRFKLFPTKKTPKSVMKSSEKKAKKKLKKKQKREQKALEKANGTAKPKKKRNILQIVRLIIYMLKRLYKYFPEHFTVRLQRVIIVIGGKDAAATAIQYGAVRAALTYLLTFLETSFTFVTPRNSVLLLEPNYLTDESMCDIKMDASISVFSALKLLMRAYPAFRDGRKKHMSNAKARKTESPTLKNNADES